MTVLTCPRDNCEYHTEDVEIAIAIQILQLHAEGHRVPAQAIPPAVASANNIKRPSIESEISLEKFNYFVSRWTRYKNLSNLTENLQSQLLECCDEDLLLNLHRNHGETLNTMAEEVLIEEIKRLAVRGESTIISRVTLRGMFQDHQEDVRRFATRIKGQATLCNYTVKCHTCDVDISYAEAEIKDQICAGLSDSEIQKDVLALRNQHPTLEELICYIEDKEAGKRSQSALSTPGNISKISEYRKSKTKSFSKHTNEPEPQAMKGEICNWCAETGHGQRATAEVRRKNCRAWNATCNYCGRAGHLTKACYFKMKKSNKPDKSAASIATPDADSDNHTDFFCGIHALSNENGLTLDHAVYKNHTGWTTRKHKNHPMVTVSIDVAKEDFHHFNFPLPSNKTFSSVNRIAVADTGAMITVAGTNLMKSLGLTINDLIPVSMKLSAANSTKLNILGAMFIKITGKKFDSEKLLQTRQLCYIQEDDEKIYLSESALKDLGIIPESFPSIGENSVSTINKHIQSHPHGCEKNTPDGKCNCPKRTIPPTVPAALPYPATEENVEKLKQWILNRYQSSTFNTCEEQELDKMTGPPLEINVDPTVKPSVIHTPIPVPVHWQKEVKAQLERDCKLGVIEPVPWGEPTTWCSRMVIVAKSDGSPRRTIDLQPLNDASVRQTHHTPSPFHQAMSVPHNTKKTVLDAWNGYHSLPLRCEDRHYTTFITPWGRYRYKSALQGFLASGDAYTRRFDEIISHLPKKTKCIDDTMMWEDDIEKSFFQTCEFLTLCGNNGIILNPSKFQFAQDTVSFAGFQITPTTVQPLKKYLEAILDFPQPKDITGIRSWFGLVNQSSYAFSVAEKMAPFRELLKPNIKFYWDDQLQKLFEDSKEEIVKAVQHGVKLFDPKRKTSLSADWSKTGTGFSLTQKHCNCDSDIPSCCPEGWKLVLAGSQFNNKAESNYSPIEGECLAIVKALRKTKYFTQGNDNLIIATDHKPLTKILGHKKLEEINNPRLLSLKEKTLGYRYKIVHIPGKRNKIPDATSRYPISAADDDGNDSDIVPEMEQTAHVTAMSSLSSMDNIRSVTWDRVREATASDPKMMNLLHTIQSGFRGNKKFFPKHLRSFYRFRNDLYTVDGIVIYKKRIVVPANLRSEILDNLHSAHQGVTSMISRAEHSVFWPGITSDIKTTREKCTHCNIMAPSQPSAPPTEPLLPEYPFQAICSDYFVKEGYGYLVIVDRYSNWPSVHCIKDGEANSKSLITELKKHCATFGIPGEISSDGGPQYTSRQTKQFFNSYKGYQR